MREFSYWTLLYRRTWRRSAVLALINPLLFLLAIGAGLGMLVDRAGTLPGGLTYVEFFAPGLLAASVMQIAFLETAMPVFGAMHWKNSYRIASHSPLEPVHILTGHLLYVAFRVVITAVAFVATMYLLGATHTPQALLAVPGALLVGLAFAAPTAAWAVTVTRNTTIGLLFRFAILPLYMFSGTFFDIARLPDGFGVIAKALPLWHSVELVRAMTTGVSQWTVSLAHAAYLLMLTLAGFMIGRVTYRARLHG
jgi:lipooligosaccharide transport system permease protein